MSAAWPPVHTYGCSLSIGSNPDLDLAADLH